MTVRLVAIGGSWGGVDAACRLLRCLEAPLTVPVLLVLHRSRASEAALLERVLTRDTGHLAVELVDKDELTPGAVHLAPPDYHVLVEGGDRCDTVSLTVDDLVSYSRPSVDLAFETAADAIGEGVVAVLLSGLGSDGSRGMVAVHRAGGRTLVQDPDEAERSEMPQAAIATGQVDEVLPVAELGGRLGALVSGTR